MTLSSDYYKPLLPVIQSSSILTLILMRNTLHPLEERSCPIQPIQQLLRFVEVGSTSNECEKVFIPNYSLTTLLDRPEQYQLKDWGTVLITHYPDCRVLLLVSGVLSPDISTNHRPALSSPPTNHKPPSPYEATLAPIGSRPPPPHCLIWRCWQLCVFHQMVSHPRSWSAAIAAEFIWNNAEVWRLLEQLAGCSDGGRGETLTCRTQSTTDGAEQRWIGTRQQGRHAAFITFIRQ